MTHSVEPCNIKARRKNLKKITYDVIDGRKKLLMTSLVDEPFNYSFFVEHGRRPKQKPWKKT